MSEEFAEVSAPEVENVELGSEEVSEESESLEVASSETELKSDIEDAIENGASEEEVKSMIKSFELKVNGKTFTKELDLSDEDAVKRELQMASAGRQSMQKVKELEKSYDQALSELKTNPAKFFSEMGMDFDELSYNHLKGINEELQKSPEEQERDQFERELQEAREESRRLKEEKSNMEYEKVYAEQQQALNDEISDALGSHTDLPPTQKTYQRIAETMLFAMENGFDDVTVEDVLPTVKGEIEKEMQSMFDDTPLEFYEKFIGKKNMEKLRQDRLSKMKGSTDAPKVKETAKLSTKAKKNDKVRAKEFFRNLGK